MNTTTANRPFNKTNFEQMKKKKLSRRFSYYKRLSLEELECSRTKNSSMFEMWEIEIVSIKKYWKKVCRGKHDRRLYPPPSCVHEVCINYSILATCFPCLLALEQRIFIPAPSLSVFPCFYMFSIAQSGTHSDFPFSCMLLIHYSCMTDFEWYFNVRFFSFFLNLFPENESYFRKCSTKISNENGF